MMVLETGARSLLASAVSLLRFGLGFPSEYCIDVKNLYLKLQE